MPSAAGAATRVVTTQLPSSPLVQQQQAPSGSAFGPLQPLATGATTSTTQTQINSKRADKGGLNRATLLLLVGVAFALIIGVGLLIWHEGRSRRDAAKRRRQRLRSGRTPQPEAAGVGRRGPPPPPRKRHAQAARRRKR